MNNLMTGLIAGAFGRRNSVLAIPVASLLAGCATATIEDAVPLEALQQEQSEAATIDPDVAISSGVPENTGEYPNLNEVQRGEMAQMTPDEKSAYLARLRAARAEQATAGGQTRRTATEAQMKKLAQTHDDETLKEIEQASGEPDAED